MDDPVAPHPALLPAGLRDLLPPEADTEAASVAALMAVFASHGYARVKPPMMEFEENLMAGAGAAVADQTFRIMDPDSHRMMAIRADMTPQVARIAATRLAGSPRPLRLSYAGECIRTRGQRDTDRQVPQAGVELIGADSVEADAEVMVVAAEALSAIGLSRLSLDLTLPTLVPALLDESGVTGARKIALARALDRKDAAGVTEHGGDLAPMLTDLLLGAGPADGALAALSRARLTAPLRLLAERLEQVVRILRAAGPTLRLTIDPVEFRGFRYHTGIAVTVYAPGRHEELGRGGRYLAGEAEPATGLTLYADAVLRAAPERPAGRSVLIPFGTDPQIARALRAEQFATVAALGPCDPAVEAGRLRCTHVLVGARPQRLRPAGAVGEHANHG